MKMRAVQVVPCLDIGNRLFFIESLMENSKSSVIIVAYRGFSDSDGNSRPT